MFAPPASLLTALVTPLLVTVLVWSGTAALLPVLRRREILDRPNARSSHARPTPRGGGVVIVVVLLAGLFLCVALRGLWPVPAVLLLAGTAALALVSWIDDLRGLPPAPRLAAQLVSVLAVSAAILWPGLGLGVEISWALLVLMTLAWVWFVNLYNFMDGIDGITGVETLAVGAGVALVGHLGRTDDLVLPGLILAGTAAGFLLWNWHPARIFMGDVGSVPLGFVAGGLLIALALAGHPVPALILPLYYLADATWTLVRRLLQGKKIWQAHREHFYQRAVQRGASHAAVSGAVALCNLGLVGCAVLALALSASVALAVAALIVALLLVWMRGGIRSKAGVERG